MGKHDLRRHHLLSVAAIHRRQIISIAIPVPRFVQRFLQSAQEIIACRKLIIRIAEIDAAHARKTDCNHYDHGRQRGFEPPAHLPKRIRRAENQRIIENIVPVDHAADHRRVDHCGKHPDQNQHAAVAQGRFAFLERQLPSVPAEFIHAKQRRRRDKRIHRIDPADAVIIFRPVIPRRHGQKALKFLHHVQIRIFRSKRQIARALRLCKARHGHPAQRHRFQAKSVDGHRHVIRCGNQRENRYADDQIKRLRLSARREKNRRRQQDERHRNCREAIGIRRKAKQDHGQIQRPALLHACQQQIHSKQQHVRQHVRLKRPAAQNNMPRIQRQQKHRRQRIVFPRNAPRRVPHQRQGNQAHQQHRQTQRELAQPQQLDKRNQQIRIQRGHL